MASWQSLTEASLKPSQPQLKVHFWAAVHVAQLRADKTAMVARILKRSSVMEVIRVISWCGGTGWELFSEKVRTVLELKDILGQRRWSI